MATNGEKFDTEHIEHHGRGRSMTTVTLTNEQFESLYLQPKQAGKDYSLQNSFGNPTPFGLTSFLLALFPLSMDLMGFQGASPSSGVVTVGVYYGIAGIGSYLACIMEWVLGNTFPSVVFGTFGGFWIAYGFIVQPTLGIAASFSDAANAGNPVSAAAAGSGTVAYNVGIALYMITWLIFVTVYFICSLRTNLPFAMIFFTLIFGFGFLAGAYPNPVNLARGHVPIALKLLRAAGAVSFVACLAGTYIDISLLLQSVGAPGLPLFDLGHFWVKKTKQADLEAKNV